MDARTVVGDPNDPRHVSRDRYRLNGFEPTYDADDPRPASAYVQKAVDRGHWAILVFHEVLDKRIGQRDTSKAVHRQIPAWPVQTAGLVRADGRGVSPPCTSLTLANSPHSGRRTFSPWQIRRR